VHKHHIIPKHMGGTNDKSNLIELSVEDHALAHKVLYEQYGHWQDYVAWQGLAKLVSKEELIRQLNQNVQRKLVEDGTHHFVGGKIQKDKVAAGTHHFLDRQKSKERAVKRVKEGKCNLSNKPIITCPHCGKVGDNSNMKRWHFDKCKHNGPTILDQPKS
jgi:hypothetical protein